MFLLKRLGGRVCRCVGMGCERVSLDRGVDPRKEGMVEVDIVRVWSENLWNAAASAHDDIAMKESRRHVSDLDLRGLQTMFFMVMASEAFTFLLLIELIISGLD